MYLTAPVTRGTVTRYVVATGTVNPVLTIIVGSYVSGVIRDVSCDYNTRVKKGQLCAEIDPRPYQATLDQAKGQLARDSAQLAGARADLARYAVLWGQNSVAKQTYDDQDALVKEASRVPYSSTARRLRPLRSISAIPASSRRSTGRSSHATSPSDRPWRQASRRPPCS